MNETTIKSIESRAILNSKGEKTIETDVYTSKGFGRSSAPVGTSAGKNEVTQLPLNIEKLIKKAEKELYTQIKGMDSDNQANIDQTIKEADGTEKLSTYGAAITLPLSIATAKAAADSKNIPLHHHLKKRADYIFPRPLGKCIAGGRHSKKGPEIQEFLSLPQETDSFKETCLVNVKMYQEIAELLKKKDKCFTGGRGLELGYTTQLSNEECLKIMNTAKDRVKEETGIKIDIGIDAAASEIYRKGKYIYKTGEKTPEDQLNHISNLINDYNIKYVEDPFQEEDFSKHAELTQEHRDRIVCGDDLFTTNTQRLEEGIRKNACNAVLIKPNQVGTITDTEKTIKRARQQKYHTVISHRSGETNDTFISHLALAHEVPIMKIGISGGERVAKLNELIRIEKYLKGD